MSSCIWNLGFFPNDARENCPFVLTAFTGWSSERCPGIGFLSRGDREIGVLRNVEPPTRPRLECLRETGLILRCDRKVGNPFQTKQGSRPSCPDQEGRKGSEEGVPENLSVPLEGDRDFGELCGSHQGCQVPFRPPIPNVGLLLRRCSGKGLHLAMTGEPRGFSRVTAGFSSYDGEFRLPLVLALQSLESNPQLSFATRMEDWTSLGQHKRHPEFPVVTRESRCNSRKSTWFPRHREMRAFVSCMA